MKVVDLKGRVFGRLTVLGLDTYEPGKHKQWKCMCECGAEVTYRGTMLTQGVAQSCGCLRKDNGKDSLTKHGMYYHSAYATWSRMMTRCYNPKSKDYQEYGGRGIVVCERWHDVRNFIEDMGERPPSASIDREKNEKGYEPGNCRWSDPIEQANNTRRNVIVTFGGAQMTLAEYARLQGLPYKKFHHLTQTKMMSLEAATEKLKPVKP